MGARPLFFSAGGYHHHVGLNTWKSQDGISQKLKHRKPDRLKKSSTR